MKVAIISGGVWIASDDKNDVHFYSDKNRGEIAINDPSVYAGGFCPLALGFEKDKATLQVANGKDAKHYDIPLEVVDRRLRKFLADLQADYAK